eukprot:16222059-Heterocapsa_arctica.AAC.1
MRRTHAGRITFTVIVEVNTGHLPKDQTSEYTSNPRNLPLSGNIGNLIAGRGEDHSATERKPQRFRFGTFSAEPGAALLKGRTINTE